MFFTLCSSLLWSPLSSFSFFSLPFHVGGNATQQQMWSLFCSLFSYMFLFSSFLLLVADLSCIILWFQFGHCLALPPVYLMLWAILKCLHTQFPKPNMHMKVLDICSCFGWTTFKLFLYGSQSILRLMLAKLDRRQKTEVIRRYDEKYATSGVFESNEYYWRAAAESHSVQGKRI